MKSIIKYIFLASATIYYGSTTVLAAPTLARPLAPRMYNEILNARGIDAQTMETREYDHLYSRDPSRRPSDNGLTRAESQDKDKQMVHHFTKIPGYKGPPSRSPGAVTSLGALTEMPPPKKARCLCFFFQFCHNMPELTCLHILDLL